MPIVSAHIVPHVLKAFKPENENEALTHETEARRRDASRWHRDRGAETLSAPSLGLGVRVWGSVVKDRRKELVYGSGLGSGTGSSCPQR